MSTEIADLGLDTMGPYGFLWKGSESAPMGGDMVDQYLMAGHSRVAAAGVDTSKAIVARRLLGSTAGRWDSLHVVDEALEPSLVALEVAALLP